MKPYYEHAGITIYHGDCREVLPCVGRVPLILTDPPYGLGDRWTGGTWGAAPMYQDARRWDRLLESSLIHAVVAAGDDAILWGGNYYPMPPSRGLLAWVKRNSVRTMADFEIAWTTFDRPAKAYHSPVNPDGKRFHPTEKPLGLMKWCIRQAGAIASLLDPFSGGGTSLVAAKELGLRAIGIEIEERYCEIAARRLAQETLFGLEASP